MKNGIFKPNIMLKASAVLLCLVLVSAYFTSGLYAKYAVGTNRDDGARVASFKIETGIDNVKLGIEENETPGLSLGGEEETESVSIPFYVENGSEVAVGYSVKADFGVALPDYLSLILSDGSKTEELKADGAESVFVFSDFGSIAAGGQNAERAVLTLTISVSDLGEISEEVSIPTAQLTVTVFQID